MKREYLPIPQKEDIDFDRIDLESTIQEHNAGLCPNAISAHAFKTNRKNILKITWEKGDCHPSSIGFVQWSARPYRITDTCDGTRDGNVYLVTLEFCKKTGLDLEELYQKAYGDREHEQLLTEEYLQYLDSLRCETEIPAAINSLNLRRLLNSLYSMNHRSLVEVLEEAWTAQGFELERFWNVGGEDGSKIGMQIPFVEDPKDITVTAEQFC